MDKLLKEIMKEIFNQPTTTTTNNRKKPTNHSSTFELDTTHSSHTSNNQRDTIPAFIKAIVLASLDNQPYPKESYSDTVQKLLGDVNQTQLHKALITNGLLTKPNIYEVLDTYKTAEIKDYLERKGVRATGKKEELIVLLADRLTQTETNNLLKRTNLYVLSDQGRRYISRYDDYVYVAKKASRYRISVLDYHEYKRSYPDKTMFDIVKTMVKAKMKDVKNDYKKLAAVELDLAEIYEDEMTITNRTKVKEITAHQMKCIYYSLNYSEYIDYLLDDSNKQMHYTQTNHFDNTVVKLLQNNLENLLSYDIRQLPEETSLRYCIAPRRLIAELLNELSRSSRLNLERYNVAINNNEKEIIRRLTKPETSYNKPGGIRQETARPASSKPATKPTTNKPKGSTIKFE